VRSSVVVKAYPVADDAAGMLDRLEAVPMHALFLERADHPFDHAVLLRAVRRNELLAQAVAAHEGSVAARGENQAVVRAQEKP